MVDTKLIDYLCKLAKLSFTPEEKEKTAAQMESIVALMYTVKEADVNEADFPLSFPGRPEDLRADEVKPSLPPDEALANVPDRKFHFIAVKKIME